MGERYAVTAAENAVGTAYSTVGIVTGATTVRPRVYDFMVGQGGTPADNAMFYAAQRSTAAGTTTSVTPQNLDSDGPASISSAGENATAEPTYTGIPFIELSLNQRASYRWVAAPGSEIIVPATAANGLGVQVKSAAYTGTAELSLFFEE